LSIRVDVGDYTAMRGGIQFSMHEGTLDQTAAKIWTRVCMTIVERAMGDEGEFGELLYHVSEQIYSDGEVYDWTDLLNDCEVETTIIFGLQKKRMVLECLNGTSQHEDPSYLA
jgi:hypothetical protein